MGGRAVILLSGALAMLLRLADATDTKEDGDNGDVGLPSSLSSLSSSSPSSPLRKTGGFSVEDRGWSGGASGASSPAAMAGG